MANDYQDFNGGFLDPGQAGSYALGSAPAAAPAAPTSKTSGDQINAWYQQYLGRSADANPDPTGSVAWNSWSGVDPAAAEAGIKNSAEAQAYAARSGTPAAASPAAPGYTAPAANPLWGQLQQQLLRRANQSLAVDPNDPIIKAQTNAYGADQTRSMRNYLSATAEKAGPNANIGAETRHAAEVAGRNTSGFQAQLLGREVDARRKEISDALSGLYGALTAEQQQQLAAEDRNLAEKQFGANTAQQAWQDQYTSIFG